MPVFDRLAMRQLDATLSAFRPALEAGRPRSGFTKTVRKALGMSARQLALRLGVSQQAVAELERTEKASTITLQSLERAANALECHLVYGFVPRNASLEETVRQRAEKRALQMVERVSVSMALEKQAINESARERQVHELANQLLEEMPRSLWDEWPG